MFSSVKKWIKIDFQIKSYTGRSGTGMKQFSSPVDAKCYPQAKTELITDASGAEVTSTTRLYVDGSTAINVEDNVVFENREWPILSVATFYDGNTGNPDIKVVYL